MQFAHMRLAYLLHHIIIRHIENSSSILYHYIIDNKSQAINQEISNKHHTNPNQSYHKVYFNITSSLNTSNRNLNKGLRSQDLPQSISQGFSQTIKFNPIMGVI